MFVTPHYLFSAPTSHPARRTNQWAILNLIGTVRTQMCNHRIRARIVAALIAPASVFLSTERHRPVMRSPGLPPSRQFHLRVRAAQEFAFRAGLRLPISHRNEQLRSRIAVSCWYPHRLGRPVPASGDHASQPVRRIRNDCPCSRFLTRIEFYEAVPGDCGGATALPILLRNALDDCLTISTGNLR